jgi:hypothetical protein
MPTLSCEAVLVTFIKSKWTNRIAHRSRFPHSQTLTIQSWRKSVANWRPTRKWFFGEYLSPSMRVIELIEHAHATLPGLGRSQHMTDRQNTKVWFPK